MAVFVLYIFSVKSTHQFCSRKTIINSFLIFPLALSIKPIILLVLNRTKNKLMSKYDEGEEKKKKKNEKKSGADKTTIKK